MPRGQNRILHTRMSLTYVGPGHALDNQGLVRHVFEFVRFVAGDSEASGGIAIDDRRNRLRKHSITVH